MNRLIFRLWVVAALLAAVSSAQGTTWMSDFTNWSGSDATATSTYTDTEGGNARSWLAPGNPNPAPAAGWLTQGTIGGVATTAKFYEAPDNGIQTRAGFATVLPASMDAQNGVYFEWKARYGSYAMQRAPIQIAVSGTGGNGGGSDTYQSFFQVQNGTTLTILSNGGSPYSSIDPLTIPNVGDGGYHTWASVVFTSGGMAHWQLSLDGTPLLFSGTDGAHTYNPGTGAMQFSYQHAAEGVGGPAGGAPYIRLGDLHNNPFPDQWDFEFDYVKYSDVPEPGSLVLLAIGACALIWRRR